MGEELDFSDLVATTPAPTFAAFPAAMPNLDSETSKFGTLDIEDFSAFEAKDYTPKKGEYVFQVEQSQLKAAVATVGLTCGATGTTPPNVKIVVMSRGQLKLSTFSGGTFSEVVLPLYGETVPAIDRDLSFVFDFDKLNRIANSSSSFAIRVKYVPATDTVVVSPVGEAERDEKIEFSAYARTYFKDFHKRVGKPALKGKVPVSTLLAALRYSLIFAARDDQQARMSMVHVREGATWSGSDRAVGYFKSPYLDGLDLRIKFEFAATVEKMLGRLAADNTYLFETETYYIIRDANLFFGFEKFHHDYPGKTAMWEKPIADYVIADRAELSKALDRLFIADSDKGQRVRIQVDGADEVTTMRLSIVSPDGRESFAALKGKPVRRLAHPDAEGSNLPPWDALINLSKLREVIDHFTGPNVQIERIGAVAMMVTDGRDGAESRSLLIIGKSADYDAYREARRKALSTRAPAESDVSDGAEENDDEA